MTTAIKQERDINMLAECIAGVLGAAWNLEGRGEGRSVTITNKEWRLHLSLGYGSQADRLSVSGVAPQEFHARQLGGGRDISWPSITVSAEKSAEQIAKDITRRVIPETEAATAKAQQSIARDIKYKADRKKLAQEFAEVLGTSAKLNQNGEAYDIIGGKGSLDIQLIGDGQGRIIGNCNYVTPEQLRKIKSVCPELFGKGK